MLVNTYGPAARVVDHRRVRDQRRSAAGSRPAGAVSYVRPIRCAPVAVSTILRRRAAAGMRFDPARRAGSAGRAAGRHSPRLRRPARTRGDRGKSFDGVIEALLSLRAHRGHREAGCLGRLLIRVFSRLLGRLLDRLLDRLAIGVAGPNVRHSAGSSRLTSSVAWSRAAEDHGRRRVGDLVAGDVPDHDERAASRRRSRRAP